jgi:Putative helicase
MGSVMAISQSMTIEEQILYWLSLDLRVLAERLLQRFAVTVGDLPASAAHHHAEPGGLYQHSLEVALKALEEFEGSMKMERRPDGSVDSFRSSRNRSRWQYATFIAALCHDLGKLFDLEVRGKERRHALPRIEGSRSRRSQRHREMQRVDLACIHQARNRQAGSRNRPCLR